MKKNMRETMQKLKIDEGIVPLIRQLWKHNYKTHMSCEGHNSEIDSEHKKPFIIIYPNTGDNWFEQNATTYGLNNLNLNSKKPCCISEPTSARFCNHCGSSLQGLIKYGGEKLLHPEQNYQIISKEN